MLPEKQQDAKMPCVNHDCRLMESTFEVASTKQPTVISIQWSVVSRY